jgi:predicted ester cyclase
VARGDIVTGGAIYNRTRQRINLEQPHGQLAATPRRRAGRDAVDAAFGAQRTDLHLTLAEGDYVAILHTHNATSTGPFLGAPPTGVVAVVPGIELFRRREGKIAEFWRFDADVSLLAQLGLLPALQPAA